MGNQFRFRYVYHRKCCSKSIYVGYYNIIFFILLVDRNFDRFKVGSAALGRLGPQAKGLWTSNYHEFKSVDIITDNFSVRRSMNFGSISRGVDINTKKRSYGSTFYSSHSGCLFDVVRDKLELRVANFRDDYKIF